MGVSVWFWCYDRQAQGTWLLVCAAGCLRVPEKTEEKLVLFDSGCLLLLACSLLADEVAFSPPTMVHGTVFSIARAIFLARPSVAPWPDPWPSHAAGLGCTACR